MVKGSVDVRRVLWLVVLCDSFISRVGYGFFVSGYVEC